MSFEHILWLPVLCLIRILSEWVSVFVFASCVGSYVFSFCLVDFFYFKSLVSALFHSVLIPLKSAFQLESERG